MEEPTVQWRCCESECESGLYTYILEDEDVPFIHYLVYNIPGCNEIGLGTVALRYM